MLLLAGSEFPTSSESLVSSIQEGLASAGLTPKSVKVEGGNFPAVDLLAVDITGASATRSTRIPKPTEAREALLKAGKLEFQAAPLLVEGTPVHVQVNAKDVELRQYATESEKTVLSPVRAADGTVVIEVQKGDLEVLLHKAVSEAAAAHGVEIQSTKIQVTSKTPRSLSFEVEVVVKMFFVKAPLTITGDAELDDELNLRLSNLAVGGSGMAGGLAGNFLRPHFDKAQKDPISLSVLQLGEIKLRDAQVSAGDTIRLQAAFGNQA